MRVGLFVTCLVDVMRPEIGFSALKLLEAAGCEVVVPDLQTCCGQPAYSSGDRKAARALAEKFVNEFEHVDYVVIPSGSCGFRSDKAITSSSSTETSRMATP